MGRKTAANRTTRKDRKRATHVGQVQPIYPDPHPEVSRVALVNHVVWELGATWALVLIGPYLIARTALWTVTRLGLPSQFLLVGFTLSSFITHGALGQSGWLKLSPRLRSMILNTTPRLWHMALYHGLLSVLFGVPLLWFYGQVTQWQPIALTVVYGLGFLTLVEAGRTFDVLLTHRYPAKPIAKISSDVLSTPLTRPVVVHWTDLHITSSDDTDRLDQHPGLKGGNRPLRALIREYGEGVLRSSSLILVTGDITDTGKEQEWQEFFRIVPAALRKKMVLVPGNHELNIPHGVTNNPDRLLQIEQAVRSPLRLIRLIRCLLAMDAVQGQRSYVYLGKGRITTLTEYLRPLRKNLDSYRPMLDVLCSNLRLLWKRIALEQMLEKAFPMAVNVKVDGADLIVLILDSNDPAAHLGTNAFGRVSRPQLLRLVALIGELSKGSGKVAPTACSSTSELENYVLGNLIDKDSSRRYFVCMHHHIGIPWVGSDVIQRAMTIYNAHDLLHFLRPVMPTVLFNGHRHLGYLGSVKDTETGEELLQIAAGSSTTLGDEDESKADHERGPGFRAFDLAWDDARPGVRIRSTQWYGLSPGSLSSEPTVTGTPMPYQRREDADDPLRAPGVLRFGWMLFMQPFQLLALFKRWGIERDPSVFQVRRYQPQGSHPANSLAKLSFLWLIFIMPLTVALAAGLFRLARVPVDWAWVWVGLTSAITVGCLTQMAIGVTFGAIVGTVFGVAGAMTMGVLGPPGTHAGSLAYGILFGAAAGFGMTPIHSRAAGPEAGLAGRLLPGLLLAAGFGGLHLAQGGIFFRGVGSSVAVAAGAGISFLVMFLRLPIYVLEAIGTVMLLLLIRMRPARRKQVARHLPFRHDDLIHLPLPGLTSILTEVGRDDLALGSELIAEASASLAQKQAARRAKEALTAERDKGT